MAVAQKSTYQPEYAKILRDLADKIEVGDVSVERLTLSREPIEQQSGDGFHTFSPGPIVVVDLIYKIVKERAN